MPSVGGIRAESSYRCLSVWGGIFGVEYEVNSSFTDQVGWIGTPHSSVSVVEPEDLYLGYGELNRDLGSRRRHDRIRDMVKG